MKKNILFVALLLCLVTSVRAQFCNSGSGKCYQQDSCFRQSQIDSQTYKYATVHNIYMSSKASVDLYMTIYSPCTLPDSLNKKSDTINCKNCKRPFILLIHGGGFRSGCRTLMKYDCIEFAKRGYVVATIDYRMGWVPGDEKRSCTNFCFTGNCIPTQSDSCKPEYKDSANFALYRALQDASAAMRFITHYASVFNIDKNYLYIGGSSAGSIIAINVCYTDQREINQVMPRANLILGSLNNYGNTFSDKYKIAGLFDNWGSISDTNYINGTDDKIPMIAFHGIDDSIVPFAKGFPLHCTNKAYGYTYGSRTIFKRLTNIYPDLPVELYACYGGHGIFNDSIETDPRALYRIQKAICFFNRVRSGDKTQKFVRIDQQEDSISYQELDSISPVICNVNKYQYASATGNYSNNISRADVPVELIISPNPAIAQATLFIKGESKEMNFVLTDLHGRILWRKDNVREKTINLPTKDLASGLYLIMVKSDDYSGVIKFIKSN